MANIIGAGLLGFVLGALIMAVYLKKDVDRIWDEAFKAGEQYGAESERIHQALEEKERLMFSKLVIDYATGKAHWKVSGDAHGS